MEKLDKNSTKYEILNAVRALIKIDEFDIDDKYTEKPVDFSSNSDNIAITWKARHETSHIITYHYENDRLSLVDDINNCIEDLISNV